MDLQHQLVAGRRIFFKRRALKRLRAYWCQRWDNPKLRQLLSRGYEPRYYVERVELEGMFLKLERLDFLWYAGLFAVGIHLESGRFYRDPVHRTLRGIGPRAMVFPTSLADASEVELIGDWRRYARYVAEGEVPAPNWRDSGLERLAVTIERIGLLPTSVGRLSLCIDGHARNGAIEGRRLVVPIREVFWRSLAGYSERYLRQ